MRWRRASADGTFVLTTYDGCLVGYPGPSGTNWRSVLGVFGTVRGKSGTSSSGARRCGGSAFDAQGRIRLSRAHMEYAGLGHDAVVVGQGDKFEIWDQARFKALLSQDFDDVPMSWLKAASTSLFKNPRTRCCMTCSRNTPAAGTAMLLQQDETKQ